MPGKAHAGRWTGLNAAAHKQSHWMFWKLAQRLMRTMGLTAICPQPRTIKPGPGPNVYR